MFLKLIPIFITALLLQTETKTILFFGDSLTAGYGLSPDVAFPALVEKGLIK